MLSYCTLQKENNISADRTAQVLKMFCAFAVRMQQSPVFYSIGGNVCGTGYVWSPLQYTVNEFGTASDNMLQKYLHRSTIHVPYFLSIKLGYQAPRLSLVLI